LSAAPVVRRLLGPFNRVEGDLEVRLDIADGRVKAAYVNSPLYRGFEQILEGREPLDALTLVPRICGICSVAQSAASAQALADASGLTVPRNGRLAANLTLAAENLADHLTHFYVFFMPDFARAEYRRESWYEEVSARFRAGNGEAANEVLRARARWMQTMGTLAGKWPHSLALRPGGSTRPLTESDRYRLRHILGDFRRFVEKTVLGDRLEALAALSSLSDLRAWQQCAGGGDLRRFLSLAEALDLWRLGRAGDRFLSAGAYELDGEPLYAAGTWDGDAGVFDQSLVREDLTHAWYASGYGIQQPAGGSTVPMADKPGAYSWCKAPRLDGIACETGALARQLADGHELVVDFVSRGGGSVAARVVARLLELARTIPAMESWLAAINPKDPWCIAAPLAADCSGVGLVEAARGTLGHWLTVRRGRIHSYQIIAPTTWNFSPRDASGQPGPLESALRGLSVPAEGDVPASVHHVVRSFDPCMVCTVH
jgi:hydrogenase large subunit